MNTIVNTQQLKKSYQKNTVLKGIDLSVQKGSVVGLLGSNGAGKTTLIQILLGLQKADSGTSLLLDESSWELSDEVRKKIGYVPQEVELMEWMRVRQLITFTKSFYQTWDEARVNRLVSEWKIDLDKKVSDLSVGQKQKLGIILAIGHKPELLILDEPVASLDPVARRLFIKQLIEDNTEEGQTIFFSTHITSDIERIAAEVVILKEGEIYFSGELDELKEKVCRVHIRSNNQLPEVIDIGNILDATRGNQQATLLVENLDERALSQLESEYALETRIEYLNLEEIFVGIHA